MMIRLKFYSVFLAQVVRGRNGMEKIKCVYIFQEEEEGGKSEKNVFLIGSLHTSWAELGQGVKVVRGSQNWPDNDQLEKFLI